jgi:hypothetical protein
VIDARATWKSGGYSRLLWKGVPEALILVVIYDAVIARLAEGALRFEVRSGGMLGKALDLGPLLDTLQASLWHHGSVDNEWACLHVDGLNVLTLR